DQEGIVDERRYALGAFGDEDKIDPVVEDVRWNLKAMAELLQRLCRPNTPLRAKSLDDAPSEQRRVRHGKDEKPRRQNERPRHHDVSHQADASSCRHRWVAECEGEDRPKQGYGHHSGSGPVKPCTLIPLIDVHPPEAKHVVGHAIVVGGYALGWQPIPEMAHKSNPRWDLADKGFLLGFHPLPCLHEIQVVKYFLDVLVQQPVTANDEPDAEGERQRAQQDRRPQAQTVEQYHRLVAFGERACEQRPKPVNPYRNRIDDDPKSDEDRQAPCCELGVAIRARHNAVEAPPKSEPDGIAGGAHGKD